MRLSFLAAIILMAGGCATPPPAPASTGTASPVSDKSGKSPTPGGFSLDLGDLPKSAFETSTSSIPPDIPRYPAGSATQMKSRAAR